MLTSKLLNKKKIIINSLSQLVTDLVYGTFKFPASNTNAGLTVINDYENMRPDLLADRIYGDQSKWDALLKYNGISNPFSVKSGDIYYTLQFGGLDATYVKPRDIQLRGEKVSIDSNGAIIPEAKSPGKDKNRLENLANKNAQRAKGAAAAKNAKAVADGVTTGPGGALPPGVNKKGDKNVKIKNGRLVLGEDVTTINADNCPVPISRARLQAALLKDKLFL
jgi:hypothetical protein